MSTKIESHSLVIDGGLATELERRGCDVSGPLWSSRLLLDNPDAVREVHRAYFDAGADIGISASYQATYQGFAGIGIDLARARLLLRRSVDLVADARDAFLDSPHAIGRMRPLVAASIGCYGAALADGSEYRGDYRLSSVQLADWHRPRFETLVESAPDLLACETIPCLAEAEGLARLLEQSPIPAWVSFTCGDGQRLRHGERFADAVAAGLRQVVAVGINCTAPWHVEELLESIRDKVAKPIVVYPNSGEEWDARRRCWLPAAGVIDWSEATRKWRRLGACWIGGCCRTTPETIRVIRTALLEADGCRTRSPRLVE